MDIYLTDTQVRKLVNDALETSLSRYGFIGDIVGNSTGKIESCEVSRNGNTHQLRIKTHNSGTYYVEVKASIKQ